MLDRLQSRLPLSRTRLSETMAWCAGLPLKSAPVESAEIQQRRRLGEEAGKLSQRAFLSQAPGFWKSLLYRRAGQLFAKANLLGIAPLARQLRSPILQPGCDMFPSNREQQARIVEDLAEKRAAQLRLEDRYPSPLLGHPDSGRLLLYAPNENLFDGAAQYTSKGFFDVNNIPPWDTWVCFFEKYLVSWVPPQLVELASQGIDVNPEGCILWPPETGLPNE
jgi:hypothetical protein